MVAPEKKSVAVGKGFAVKRLVQKPRPVQKKGISSKRRQHVKAVIREVAGFAPYERRCMELLKNGLDKRALKLCKKRVSFYTTSQCTNSFSLEHINEPSERGKKCQLF